MRVRFDPDADALYIRLAETEIDKSEEVRPGIVLDYDVAGRVVGIEVLGAATAAGSRPRDHRDGGRGSTRGVNPRPGRSTPPSHAAGR